MLHVTSPEGALRLIREHFGKLSCGVEAVSLADALGRTLGRDIKASVDVPGFDRSTVDGYALWASDTFGCSESLPSVLRLAGEVQMGKPAGIHCGTGQAVAVPTGGQLPAGADGVAMLEYAEEYGDGTVGITKPVAPGQNIILKSDDVAAGQRVLEKGKRLGPADIGTLAALGVTRVDVARRPLVGILSTGDEVVPAEDTPSPGKIRDVNAPLLAACAEGSGGIPRLYGICPDNYEMLLRKVEQMNGECDITLVSGGSSAGARDVAAQVVQAAGELLLHGIAIKPGKPTLVGKVGGKPVFGLPGHPMAAYFVYTIFVDPCLRGIMGGGHNLPRPGYRAQLASAAPSNHGREEYVAVRLEGTGDGLRALPIMGKSGLITRLSRADGYLRVPRDREGYSPGDWVEITAL